MENHPFSQMQTAGTMLDNSPATEQEQQEGAFDFFSDVEMVTPERKQTERAGKDWLPENGQFRVHQNGVVMPSANATADYSLEYTNDQDDSGNGLDIIDARSFLKPAKNIVLIGITPRKDGKVDVFRSTKYDKEGNPISSIYDQKIAPPSSVNNLADLITEVYGLTEEDWENGYVDVELVQEMPARKKQDGSDAPFVIVKDTHKRDGSVAKKSYNRHNTRIFAIKVYAANRTVAIG